MNRLWFAMLMAATLAAAEYEAPEGYLSDFARVVDASSRAELEAICGKFERATGVQLAFVTVPTTGDQPIDDFANKLAIKWGVGQKGKNEGLLVLFAINDRKSRVEVGYGLEEFLPDGMVGRTLRANRESLQQGQYGAAFVSIAQTFAGQIARGKGVSFDQDDPVAGPENPLAGWMPILILGGMALFILFIIVSSRGQRGYFHRGGRGGGGGPFIFTGGDGGGWGGGGFGGSGSSDSGSSFGGFGGGDFGGGGASGDW